MWMRRVISIFIFSERATRGGGGGRGGAARHFFFFPVQQTTSGIGHRVKWFFGLATNALNVRSNNNNSSNSVHSSASWAKILSIWRVGDRRTRK